MEKYYLQKEKKWNNEIKKEKERRVNKMREIIEIEKEKNRI